MCSLQHRLLVNETLVTKLKQRIKGTMKIVTPFPVKLLTGVCQHLKNRDEMEAEFAQ